MMYGALALIGESMTVHATSAATCRSIVFFSDPIQLFEKCSLTNLPIRQGAAVRYRCEHYFLVSTKMNERGACFERLNGAVN